MAHSKRIFIWKKGRISQCYSAGSGAKTSLSGLPLRNKKGLTLVQALWGQEICLFWLVDSYWGYLISNWLAILLFIVGFSTKPNAETVVSHWIMIWCWLFLTRIDVMYIVQDRWGLLADENRESLGAVNCVVRPPWHQIFLREKELKMAKYLILLHRPFADEQGKTA